MGGRGGGGKVCKRMKFGLINMAPALRGRFSAVCVPEAKVLEMHQVQRFVRH